jgi:uncharacterized protein (TIGR03083 family)
MDCAHLGPQLDARPLFAPELAALLGTLRALRPEEWHLEAVPGWTVHDVAAHLLGDCYGRLSRGRDGHRAGPAPAADEPLPRFIDRLNHQWVDAFARVSPAALVDTLELIGGQTVQFFEDAEPDSPSTGVSWAGIDPAPMWLDSARELTELWTHRQQIRHAVGQGTDPQALPFVLDTFLRALPHTLRSTTAPVGTQVEVRVGRSRWVVTRTAERWSLGIPFAGAPRASVQLDPELAWRLCVRGVEPSDALTRATVVGDRALAAAVCEVLSIVR